MGTSAAGSNNEKMESRHLQEEASEIDQGEIDQGDNDQGDNDQGDKDAKKTGEMHRWVHRAGNSVRMLRQLTL